METFEKKKIVFLPLLGSSSAFIQTFRHLCACWWFVNNNTDFLLSVRSAAVNTTLQIQPPHHVAQTIVFVKMLCKMLPIIFWFLRTINNTSVYLVTWLIGFSSYAKKTKKNPEFSAMHCLCKWLKDFFVCPLFNVFGYRWNCSHSVCTCVSLSYFFL